MTTSNKAADRLQAEVDMHKAIDRLVEIDPHRALCAILLRGMSMAMEVSREQGNPPMDKFSVGLGGMGSVYFEVGFDVEGPVQ